MLANALISFKVGLQRLPAQSTIEAELVTAALTMKKAVFRSIMVLELGSDESSGRVPLYIDDTSALHVAGNRTYSPRAKHIARMEFFVQELVEEGKISIHYVNSEDQLTDLSTKHLSKHRRRDLIKLHNESPISSSPTRGRLSYFCARNTCVLIIMSSVLCSFYRSARTLHCSFVAGSSH